MDSGSGARTKHDRIRSVSAEHDQNHNIATDYDDSR
jgi:hypothetical protein